MFLKDRKLNSYFALHGGSQSEKDGGKMVFRHEV